MTARPRVLAMFVGLLFVVTPVACRTAADDPMPRQSALGSGPLWDRLEWVLKNFNAGGFSSFEDDELRENFSESFLKAVPPARFRMLSRQIAASGPYVAERFERPPTSTNGMAILNGRDGAKFRLSITIEASTPYRITGLFVQPAPDLGETAANSWDEFDEKLRPLASRVGFLAGEIRDDEIIPVHELSPDRRLAIGSTFKLYILGEIARQVGDGEANWQEELAIKSELKSLPSGEMRNEKAGKKFTMAHFAEQMISVSDNTATDHLLFRAGREKVEEFQASMGHAHPEANIPFPSTRDMFILKLGPSRRAEEYIEADSRRRRRILDTEFVKEDLPRPLLPWTGPRYVSELEWFASPADLGRAMAVLKKMTERQGLEVVAGILSANPGAPFDRKKWPFIGFKGGSEPGVLNMTWLLRRFDNRWFVLTAGLNDDERTIKTNDVLSLMISASTLLSET